MKKKILAYTLLPALGIGILGAGLTSAHGWFGKFSNLAPEEIAQHQQIMFEKKAEFLGITVDQLKDAWAEGKTLSEIAEQYGVTQEQLQERFRAQAQEKMQFHIQALVDNGVITQEQAEQKFQFMENKLENAKFGRRFHKGFGW